MTTILQSQYFFRLRWSPIRNSSGIRFSSDFFLCLEDPSFSDICMNIQICGKVFQDIFFTIAVCRFFVGRITKRKRRGKEMTTRPKHFAYVSFNSTFWCHLRLARVKLNPGLLSSAWRSKHLSGNAGRWSERFSFQWVELTSTHWGILHPYPLCNFRPESSTSD